MSQTEFIRSHREYIIEQTRLKSDESKRQGRTIKNFADIFNVNFED